MTDSLERFRNTYAKRWAVVGFTREMAGRIMDEIEESRVDEIVRRTRSACEMRTEFVDGVVLFWLRASASSRGRRFGKMWCDKSINKDVFDCIVIPQYLGKREDIIWIGDASSSDWWNLYARQIEFGGDGFEQRRICAV